MGTVFAILKTFGNLSLKNDLQIGSDNGPDKMSLASLTIFVGMLFEITRFNSQKVLV